MVIMGQNKLRQLHYQSGTADPAAPDGFEIRSRRGRSLTDITSSGDVIPASIGTGRRPSTEPASAATKILLSAARFVDQRADRIVGHHGFRRNAGAAFGQPRCGCGARNPPIATNT
jgi:hypothetical protein